MMADRTAICRGRCIRRAGNRAPHHVRRNAADSNQVAIQRFSCTHKSARAVQPSQFCLHLVSPKKKYRRDMCERVKSDHETLYINIDTQTMLTLSIYIYIRACSDVYSAERPRERWTKTTCTHQRSPSIRTPLNHIDHAHAYRKYK